MGSEMLAASSRYMMKIQEKQGPVSLLTSPIIIIIKKEKKEEEAPRRTRLIIILKSRLQ